jgi:hypothetical protein
VNVQSVVEFRTAYVWDKLLISLVERSVIHLYNTFLSSYHFLITVTGIISACISFATEGQ